MNSTPSRSQPLIVPLLVLMIQCVFVFGLVSCGETKEAPKVNLNAVHIENGDECHLCGMIINQFAGPKGEMFEKGKSSVRKFCSINDLFAYMLQPENLHNTVKVYVHDMAIGTWEDTQEKQLIDAKEAWFVSGHKLQGAMGPSLASFKQQADAEAFIVAQGGDLLTFSDITLERLNQHATHMSM